MNKWHYTFFGFLLNLISTFGSLFLSEVMKHPPCTLCWYQRLALFPLVILFGVGFLDRDRRYKNYAWPFVVLGLTIAIAHNLLYYGIIPESLSPCSEGVSCKTQPVIWFGFLTIPLLSLIAFLLNAAVLYLFDSRKEVQ